MTLHYRVVSGGDGDRARRTFQFTSQLTPDALMGGVTAALTDMGFEVTSGESADPYKAKGSLLTPKGLIGLGLQVRLSTNQQTRLCLTCLLSGVRPARRRRRRPFSPGAQARCVHASLVLSVLITQKIQHHSITYVHKSLYLSVSLYVLY